MRSLAYLLAALVVGSASCTPDAAAASAASAPAPAPATTPAPAAVPDVAAGSVPTPGDYTCPMHSDVKSAAPGTCPKCGMDLVASAPSSTPTVRITSTPPKPRAGEEVHLVFQMQDGAKTLSEFDVVHEKKLHLLMVTPDLAWFAHEHPDIQPDGTFALDFAFPKGGTYRLFSDFKAAGRSPAVVPVDIAVDGDTPPAKALVPSDLKKPVENNGYLVRMTTATPASGGLSTMKFLVARDGKPVKHLEPYLGALGHLVILGDDAKTFLHAHPEEHAAPHDDTGKPHHAHPSTGEVAFATRFPKPGIYKAWAQFQHKGRIVVADFVFDVKPGAAGIADADDHHHAHEH